MKDAHGSGRNIAQEALPVEATLIRLEQPSAHGKEFDDTWMSSG